MQMQFLHNASISGVVPLQQQGRVVTTTVQKTVRKSQSHAILSPLVQLVRDPAGSLGNVLETFWVTDEVTSAERTRVEELQNRKQILQQRMDDALDYPSWKAAATELDVVDGKDDWKRDPISQYYNHELLGSRLNELNEARTSGDASRMLFLIRTSLTRSLGNMGDVHLYQNSRIGTKFLIDDYISAACSTLNSFLESYEKNPNSKLEPRLVMDQLLATRQAFGRSALLLSGGGTFGMSHIGVVKCLWENKLLPRIISGASAGSIVCSVLCAQTDEELPDTMNEFCFGDLEVFGYEKEETLLRKAARFAKYGALFDINHLTRVMRGLIGDLTFQEAYNRTRRILNISVSTASVHELPRLLNYITAPNVIIWSAVAASCSVPLIFSPAPLLSKDPKTGEQVPWNPSPQKWMDGSIDNDLPMTRLAEMFNVNHFIVSQVNPHVVPFLVNDSINSDASPDGPEESSSTGWLNSLAGFAKSEALHRMHVLSELGVFPNYFTKLRSVLSQKYSGDITILPEISYTQFPRILRNPTPEFMLKAVVCGERATWPKLSRIQNHCAIELALDDAVQRLRTKIAFSPSQVDLRMISLGSMSSEKQDTKFPLVQRRRGRLMGRSSRSKTKSWHEAEKVVEFASHSPEAIRASLPPQLLPGVTGAKLTHFGTAPSVIDPEPDSGSESDDEDEEEVDHGMTYMRVVDRQPHSKNMSHSRHKSGPVRNTGFASNAYEQDVEANLTTTTAYDSSFSNPRSYSPSSEARSPPEHAQESYEGMVRSTPTLWPTRSRPYIVASTPTTPGVVVSSSQHFNEQDVGESEDTMEVDEQREQKDGRLAKSKSFTESHGSNLDISGTRGMMLRKKNMR